MKRFFAWALAAALAWACAATAHAHKPSDSYLSLEATPEGIAGRWDIALRDLEAAIGLDADGDGLITWGETRARHAEIAAHALARLAVRGDGAACEVAAPQQQVDRHTDGAYTVLQLKVQCPHRPAELEVTYRLFADLDPQHRGLLNLKSSGGTRTAVLGPEAPSRRFVLGEAGGWGQFADYAREGVWHIWIGFDHILFLLSLLLPAVLVWRKPKWEAAGSFGGAFWEVAKIVTAFTLAHSITLSLAALQWISLPSRWVESVIAASVVMAALNNVWPLFQERRWLVAFGFGLIHGFGFAGVLADLGLPHGALALALAGFNLGVEVGQLAIVAVFLPLAYGMRRSWVYRRLVLIGGSLAIAVVAAVWFAERLLEFKWLPV